MEVVDPSLDPFEARIHLAPHRDELGLRFYSQGPQVGIHLVEPPIHGIEPPVDRIEPPVDRIEAHVGVLCEIGQTGIGPAVSHDFHDRTVKASVSRVARRIKILCNACVEILRISPRA